MYTSLADDPTKNIVVYVNDFYPEFATAFTKLSQKLGRPLRGIMLIDAERKASGKNLADKEGFFEEIVVDFSDDAALARAIKPLENNLLLVSCDSERGQLYFKRVIPHVPYVNTPTESSLDYCTNKGKMRELLRAYDETISPKALAVHDTSKDTVQRICTELEFPLIIKPANLASSILVNKVTNEDELQQVLEKSFVSLNKVYSQYRGLGERTMVVEEFVVGDLFSIDVYVDSRGKVYTLPLIHFENASMVGLEGYQVYRSETYLALSSRERQEGAVVAGKAIHAVGLRSSVAHIELFHTTNGWKVVELGARPGGDRQGLYELSYGIDHALNELLVKIDVEPEMPTMLKMYSETFNIHAPSTGVVDSITGVEEVLNHPSVYYMHVNVAAGDKVLPNAQGGNTLIEGLMYNKDLEQLNKDAKFVRSTLRVNIRQDEGN